MRVLGKVDLQNSILLDELQTLLLKYTVMNVFNRKNEQEVEEHDTNMTAEMAISVAPTDETSEN